MKAAALATAALLVLAAWLAPTAGALAGEAATAECAVPVDEDSNAWADRSETLARYEQLSTECLKTVVLECARVANRVLLDPGSAAVCSFGYEALLRRGFGGDFRALVAWWHSARDETLQ